VSPERLRYLVVEGPIGVGKTTLARRLAERFDAELVLERPEENPFLARFYEDLPRYALPTQLFFLMQRGEQLREVSQPSLFRGTTVSDFLFDKDPLFARLTLDGEELALYQKVFDSLKPQAPRPDLVVYLQARVETLVERVRRRGIGYERPISAGYLAALADAYANFFHHFDAAPLMVVNAERLNFADRPRDFDLLIERLHAMRGRREYFNLS
jgi:deoxyadenosine/deoxycytidine kinase